MFVTPIILWTYGLLSLAVLGLWLPGKCWLTPLALAAAIAAGLYGRILQPLALLWPVLLATGLLLAERAALAKFWRTLAWLVALIVATGLIFHWLPGFANPKVIADWRFGLDSLPYSKYLNFDGILLGLCVLGCTRHRLPKVGEWRQLGKRVLPILLLTTIAVLGASLALAFVRWQPKWSELFWLWAWGNLLSTCLVEEAFFRGLLQRGLMRWLKRWRHGEKSAIVLAAALFGLKHLPGGWTYAGLATLAGIGYGTAYQATGRVEAAILSHFGLNCLHFLLFSYPALSAGGI
ncbi:CPBP family intramembrane metalloprotease [Methylomonas sp. EFPC3]|uniref:CPBP family intramembrane glutamic endopeptidase n=1 Tax=Methylomonas sp. EFPC3 TaxID=3021710 RepID=UPI002415DC6A|nr:CPBP family intramembrane glutamic endopeptidase [Methylomonas sp. EFPC3]WFP50764.1 CPBP family intramembrane metalloprotease [Methylomonas sp. EFPC3]